MRCAAYPTYVPRKLMGVTSADADVCNPPLQCKYRWNNYLLLHTIIVTNTVNYDFRVSESKERYALTPDTRETRHFSYS